MRTRLSMILVVAAVVVTGCGRNSSDKPNVGNESQRYFPRGRSSEFLEASHRYGELYVRPGKFHRDLQEEGGRVPWSAYWMPKNKPYLFQSRNNQPAPLQKYDLFARLVKGRNTFAAEFEADSKNDLYKENADNWEGLCHAWALASIMELEPRKPRSFNGVDFSVADLKALLIKTYEGVEQLPSAGQRYVGGARSEYQDIYPDQFHLVLKNELLDKGQPFIMDYDPDEEIWNSPVFYASGEVTQDGDDPRIMHVELDVAIKAFVDGTYENLTDAQLDALLSRTRNFHYTYDLMGDVQPDGSILVRDGAWTGRSFDDHPDFVTIRPEKVERRTKNQQLSLKMIDEILGKR